MVYKLGYEAETGSLPFPVSGKFYDSLFEFLIVLDNEYGADRDAEQDDEAVALYGLMQAAVKDKQTAGSLPGG